MRVLSAYEAQVETLTTDICPKQAGQREEMFVHFFWPKMDTQIFVRKCLRALTQLVIYHIVFKGVGISIGEETNEKSYACFLYWLRSHVHIQAMRTAIAKVLHLYQHLKMPITVVRLCTYIPLGGNGTRPYTNIEF